MKNDKHPDAVDEAFAAIRRISIPERPSDVGLLERLSSAATPDSVQAMKPRTKFQLSKKGRLMRTMIWSSTVAALCALCAMFLLSGPASVALADVIKAAEKHKLVKYTMSQADESKDESPISPLVEVAYADLKSPRYRKEAKLLTLNNWVEHESYFVTDGPKNLKLHVVTELLTTNGIEIPSRDKTESESERLKNSGRFPRREASISAAYGDFTPATATLDKPILENLQDLEKHKDAIPTKDKLDGKDVLKYRIEEKFKTTILTVDAATKLPLKLEYENSDPNILHPTVLKMKFVLSDFDWDPDLNGRTIDELFDTTPPAGYTIDDRRK